MFRIGVATCIGVWFLVVAELPGRADDDKDAPTVEEAVARLKDLRAEFTVDRKKPGGPIITVDLKSNQIGPDDLEVLSALKSLESLSLQGGGKEVNAQGLRYLQRIPGLKHLNLKFCYFVDDKAAAELAPLTNLVSLDLTATKVTDKGLKSFQGMEHMEKLTLPRAISSLEPLAKMTAMTSLHLELTNVTDYGLASVSGMKKLRQLDLSGTGISAAGLKHLSDLEDLERLNLEMETPTSPEASDQILSVDDLEKDLGRLKKLKEVRLGKSTYSRRERLRLGRLWPAATIYTRGEVIKPTSGKSP